MTPFARLGAAACLLSVAAGAFGAHALKAKLSPDMLAVWETGARYMMYHGLGLLFVGWLAQAAPGSNAAFAGWCFVGGIALFSGSLFALALSGIRVLGAITPVGGLLFLAGWAALLLSRR